MLASENGSQNEMTSIQNIDGIFEYCIIKSSHANTIKCSAFVIGV